MKGSPDIKQIPGHATGEGTARYAERFPELKEAGHFRRLEFPETVRSTASELVLPSIGHGSYLGETDAASREGYTSAARRSLASGIHLLDTAINYRYQLSERDFGAAIAAEITSGQLSRDELIVCTKAGFLTTDAEISGTPTDYLQREYIQTGVLDPEEIVGGMHSMAPKFLEDQIERSRRNLGLATIDVFYLHNPETQLSEIPRELFLERLHKAFTLLERKVKEGVIRYYGTATWNGYRVAPSAPEALNLAEIADVARHAGGESHHFRFVQLPFNLAMPEAFTLRNQADTKRAVSTLELCHKLGIVAVGSASLLQTRIFGRIPEHLEQKLNAGSDYANCIQFARSAPGLVTALVGMAQPEHVTRNVEAVKRASIPREQWISLFRN